jgi:hypothetical protein
LKLDDFARKECKDGNKVSLFEYNIAYYGKTWYEKQFNAYLKDDSIRNEYYKRLERLKSVDFKLEKSDKLIARIPNLIFIKLFRSSNTLEEFFNVIKSISNNPEQLCDLSADWLDSFVDYVLFDDEQFTRFKNNWMIDLTTIPDIEIITKNSEITSSTISQPNELKEKYFYDLINLGTSFYNKSIRNYTDENIFYLKYLV